MRAMIPAVWKTESIVSTNWNQPDDLPKKRTEMLSCLLWMNSTKTSTPTPNGTSPSNSMANAVSFITTRFGESTTQKEAGRLQKNGVQLFQKLRKVRLLSMRIYKSSIEGFFFICWPEDGHYIGFVPLDLEDSANKWYRDALNENRTQARLLKQLDNGWGYQFENIADLKGTFEFLGPKLQGNPHKLDHHCFMRHGTIKPLHPPPSFKLPDLKKWFEDEPDGGVEGIVLHGEGNKMWKLTRHHLGLPWPPSTILQRIENKNWHSGGTCLFL